MKKMIALLLAALMICAMFTGCGEKGTTLKSVQKAGKLTIATSPDFPPVRIPRRQQRGRRH